MLVCKKISFDAAHYLPGYPGKCANLHGHHWVVELGVEGEVDPETGMVVDFSRLKEFWEDNFQEVFDHKCLNDTISNPTAENIAIYISEACGWLKVVKLKLVFIRVWETPDSYAEFRGKDA